MPLGVTPPHIVVTEVENIMQTGDDGGKYEVSFRFHVTVVDGELKTLTDHFDATCIRQPGN